MSPTMPDARFRLVPVGRHTSERTPEASFDRCRMLVARAHA